MTNLHWVHRQDLCLLTEPHWQGVTFCSLITEVKQFWSWLVLGWVTIWVTLLAAKDVIDACHALLWLMYEHTRGSQIATKLIKRLGCAVMSMWLVHIKNMCGLLEHAQPLYFYLPWVSVWVLHWRAKQQRRYCLIWDGRSVWSPGIWSGRGWLPLKKEWHSMESGLGRKKCKVTLENLCRSHIPNALYKCTEMKIIINTTLPTWLGLGIIPF